MFSCGKNLKPKVKAQESNAQSKSKQETTQAEKSQESDYQITGVESYNKGYGDAFQILDSEPGIMYFSFGREAAIYNLPYASLWNITAISPNGLVFREQYILNESDSYAPDK